MPVVSMMRFPGDPDDLVARMRELAATTTALAEKHGGLAHIVARDADGILVVNLWEHEQGRHDMAEEPAVKEALAAAGLGPPAFEGYEILDLFVSERLAATATVG